MWHYLYFTVLVKVKDPTEFTGPESYVHEMVKVNNSFVTQGLAMCYTHKTKNINTNILIFFFFIYSNVTWNGFQDYKRFH